MKINCSEIKKEMIESFKTQDTKGMKLTILLCAGASKASEVYVNKKIELCNKLGIENELIFFDEDSTIANFEEAIENASDSTGIIIQLPLFDHLKEHEDHILNLVPRHQDVDGFRKDSLVKGATCNAVFKILDKEYNTLEGKKVLLIGRGKTAGRHIADELIDKGATTIVCNSKTQRKFVATVDADVIIGAANVPLSDHFLFKQSLGGLLKKKELCIDVGIFRTEEGKLRGCFSEDAKAASLKKMLNDEDLPDNDSMNYTSVPGGIGLLTVVCLIENLFKLREVSNG